MLTLSNVQCQAHWHSHDILTGGIKREGTEGRGIFENVCISKWNFMHIKCRRGRVSYVNWLRQIPYFFTLRIIRGGGGRPWPPCAPSATPVVKLTMKEHNVTVYGYLL